MTSTLHTETDSTSNAETSAPPERTGQLSRRYAPLLRLLAIVMTGILIADVVAMLAVNAFGPIPYPWTIFMDAGVMVILIFPVLYFFSVRPLLNHISNHHQADRALHQKEELQERFFNSIDVLIAYMDSGFNFIRVNDAYAKAGGYSREFFTGKNHFVLYPHAENEQIFQRVVETGQAYIVHEKPFEYPDQPERGVTYWNWSLQPVRRANGSVDGLVLSLVDVTERKRAEQKVELERARLRSILDAMPDGIYMVNQQHEIEYTNPVIESQFGAAGGRKCYAYFYDRAEPCSWCPNNAASEGPSLSREWNSSKTGKIYEVFDTSLTNSDGSLSRLQLVHDITKRKKAETELERRNLELQVLSAEEYKQRQTAETLRASSQALTQTLDLDYVIRTLLKHVRALVHSDTASVVFLDGESIWTVRGVDGYENLTDPNKILSITVNGENNRLIQRLIGTQKSVVIPDIREDSDWIVYPGMEAILNYVGVPILSGDRVIGFVGLGKTKPKYFSEEHVQWAEALVGQAAVAIQNAWLFEQVRAGHERLQSLSRRLVEIQEQERRFIARELHDHAGQTLTSLILGLWMLEKEADKPQEVLVRAAELKAMTDDVLEELHRIAINLRPASLDHLGLVPALEQLIKAYTQNSSLNIRFKAVDVGEDDRLPQEVETNLYRIAQEALTNVIRHANASRADVVLKRRDKTILILVEDNGNGFDVELRKEGGHLGLLGMQERAEMLGGTLTVESMEGRGTTLVVEVPYADKDYARR